MSNRLNWQIINNGSTISSYNIYRSIVGVESAQDAPFQLADGMILSVKIDDFSAVNVVFNSVDFVDITNATAEEVVSVLQSQLSTAISHIGVSGSVYIRSELEGGSVQVVGGTANAIFGFPEQQIFEKSNFVKIDNIPHVDGVIEYIDDDGRVYDWYKLTAVDTLMVESAPTLEKQAESSRVPTCIVYGKLIDARGYPICDQKVAATIEYVPSSQCSTGNFISKETIETLSLRDGTFELDLVRGASYRIVIEAVEFNRIVKIPDAVSADLLSADFEEKGLSGSGDNFCF